MSRNDNLSLSISKYKELLDKDNRSKAFAPLAELYRKAGYIDESLRTLKQGLKYNPSYVLGYLVLTNCYCDLGQYNLAYDTIHPFVELHRENLQLQKTFGLVCKKLNKLDEGLVAFKHLLFLNPKDFEVAQKIREIEELVNPIQDFLATDILLTQKVNNTPKEITDIDGWEQLNFFPKHDHQSKDVSNEKKSQPIIIDNVSEEPLNTVSIAHLYLNQGHLDKAEEVINKILELRPNDAESIRLQKIIDAKKNGELSEDLGRKNLMNIIDEKVLDNRAPDYVILENFLQHIQKKALEKRA